MSLADLQASLPTRMDTAWYWDVDDRDCESVLAASLVASRRSRSNHHKAPRRIRMKAIVIRFISSLFF
jgi:hypothetical protein